MTKRYFILRDGRQAGPYTVDRLQELRITPETRVWDEEAFNWVPAASVSDLQDILAQPVQAPVAPRGGLFSWLRT